MPDTRLTWFNIREHLRKFVWIYMLMIAITLMVSNLLWLSTAPQIPEEARVLIYMADQWSNPELLDDIAADALQRAQADDDTLREVVFESLLFTDAETDYTSAMLLMTRLAVGEGDAFLASPNAMDALVQSGVCLALDEYWAEGWLADSGLEPYYATVTDEETGETATILAGLRLDSLTALSRRKAFTNEGAYLIITVNSTNLETTMRTVEYIIEDLREESAQ